MSNLILLLELSFLSLLGASVSIIVKWILSWFNKKSSEERTLLSELRAIKRELAGMSMVDEFAKYAKLERKAIQIQDLLRAKAKNHMGNLLKYNLIMTYTAQIILSLTIIGFLWMYRYEPVVRLPKAWLFPVGGILSWPTGQPGVISVSAWLLLCGSSFRMLIHSASFQKGKEDLQNWLLQRPLM